MKMVLNYCRRHYREDKQSLSISC